MNSIAKELLHNVIVFSKYAQYLPELKRRETWQEIVDRNMNMHIRKFPFLEEEIREHYKQVFSKQVLPSMRSLQFAGTAIERQNTRMYNCCALPIDNLRAFAEIMYLLLGGSGVGYSVQRHHVSQLPSTSERVGKQKYVIDDSREGWSDAIDILICSYFGNSPQPIFDYSQIRAEGSPISTGGIAPGPHLLRKCLDNIAKIMDNVSGCLTSLQAHDIICHIADLVACGGVRRSALIALFSVDDEEMMYCKSGTWYKDNLQRSRANNSVVLHRDSVERTQFDTLWSCVKQSGCGEPGIFFSNDMDGMCNPCAEIALRPFQFCNLCEINASDIDTQKQLNMRAKTAAFIGTLQAAYTDFHYLRDIWRKTTEEEALIGVGMTGICAGSVYKLNLREAAQIVVKENARVAKLIGINAAARCTTVKPSGTTSLVLGTSSGIHPWFGKYYVRRVSIEKRSALYKFLAQHNPEILEDDVYTTLNSVVCFPLKAPDNAILRDESALDLLERVKLFNVEWIRGGHVHGINMNNVSATVSIKNDEWAGAGEWMWANKDYYNGLSVLPYSDTIFVQMPFTECTREEYEERLSRIKDLNFDTIVEETDCVDHTLDEACTGGKCDF